MKNEQKIEHENFFRFLILALHNEWICRATNEKTIKWLNNKWNLLQLLHGNVIEFYPKTLWTHFTGFIRHSIKSRPSIKLRFPQKKTYLYDIHSHSQQIKSRLCGHTYGKFYLWFIISKVYIGKCCSYILDDKELSLAHFLVIFAISFDVDFRLRKPLKRLTLHRF